jgi:hypothetical protein
LRDNDIEPSAAWLPVLRRLQARIAHGDALRDRLVAACEAPGGLKRIRASSVLEYRCQARRCLLLIVWQTPGCRVFYQPPYRLAPGYNAEHSNDAGRAHNTLDGDRIWKAQAGVLDHRYRRIPGATIGLELHCGHVSQVVPGHEVVDDAESATPGHPRRHFL